MDSKVWKPAATSFKIMNPQKGIFAAKMIQVNGGKYLCTEKLAKKPTGILSEESVKEEDKIIHANGTANCTSGIKSVEPDKEMKVCVLQRKSKIYKRSVDKWADLISNSEDYRKSLALTTFDMESRDVTRLPSEVENNRLPILVSDVGCPLVPQHQERSSVLFRQDGKIKCIEVKNQVSNHCSKTKSARTNNVQKKEPIFQCIEDACCQDAGLGIPLKCSNKRIMSKKNIAHHNDTSDPCKRIKISDDMPVRNVGRICQKMFNQHQLPHRQMPTYSDNTNSVTCKTATNGMKKDIIRSSLPDEIKGGGTNFKEKDKTEGSSTHRSFLLIDSQGLPYTVVVEEPISIGLSNSISASWSGSTLARVSKSLAPRKVYKCPVCFRIFEYLSYLQRHSIAHSQQKPYVCKVCGKAFKRTSHLTRHRYTHFGGKSCQCQICQCRFQNAGELTHHQQSHTGDKNH